MLCAKHLMRIFLVYFLFLVWEFFENFVLCILLFFYNIYVFILCVLINQG